MKILLIRPPSEMKIRWPNIPLGISYIASVLEDSGEEVYVIDYLIDDYDKVKLTQFIMDNSIDVVGLGFLTLDCYYAKALIRDIKEVVSINIVVGGPHATVEYIDMLQSGADFVVIGEGEKTVIDLMKYLKNEVSIDSVRGLAYKHNGNIQLTNKRDFVENLDEIPYPAFHLLNMRVYAESAKHTGGYNILSSRGCPADCSFCTKRVFGYRIRKRSPENVISEIALLYWEHGIKTFCFADDYFLSSNAWVSRFCDLLKQSGIEAKYWAQGRVDNKIEPEVFKKMVEVGFFGISFGIESGDQEILDGIGKRITPEKARTSVAVARNAGFLMVEAGFILGFPQDTRKSMERTIKLAGEIDTTISHVTFFTSFPGTKIQEMIEKDSRVTYEKDYRKLNLLKPTLTTDQFSEDDLWRYHDRLIYIKMKKRLLEEIANIPKFMLKAFKRDQSLKQVAYIHFPAAIKYYKNIWPCVCRHGNRVMR